MRFTKRKFILLLFILLPVSENFAQQQIEWAIAPQYDECFRFMEGTALAAKRDSVYLIDTTGKVLKVFLSGTIGARSGKHLIMFRTANGMSGYLNRQGNVAIPAKFHAVHPFQEGLAVVQIGLNRFGAIDSTGRVIIKPQYSLLQYCTEGLIGARDPIKNKWGYIDREGKQVIPFKFDYYGDKSENDMASFGVLPFSEGLAVSYLDKKAGYIDKKGNVVIPHQYEGAWSFENGAAKVKLNGKTSFIDRRGNAIKEPEKKPSDVPVATFPEFEEVGPVSEGMMAAKKNGKWGYVKVQ